MSPEVDQNDILGVLSFNPRLTKGGWLQPPLHFPPGRSKMLKKVTKGIKVIISFTSFAVIFMKKKIGGTTLLGVG